MKCFMLCFAILAQFSSPVLAEDWYFGAAPTAVPGLMSPAIATPDVILTQPYRAPVIDLTPNYLYDEGNGRQTIVDGRTMRSTYLYGSTSSNVTAVILPNGTIKYLTDGVVK